MLKKIWDKYQKLSEKDRVVASNIMGAFFVKGLAMLVSLLTMPAYLRFFHNEVALGLWFTILSVLNWILNFDLGIGNGLRNHLTAALAAKDQKNAKYYVSSAYLSIGAICTVITAVFVGLFRFVNWNALFNIQEHIVSSEAMLSTVKIVFVGIMLQMFLKIITSVLYAIQKSSVNNFLTLVTSVITLLCVMVLPSADNDRNMITMAIVHVCAVIIPLVVATVAVFLRRELRGCLPSTKYFSKSHTKAVLTLGSTFLLVQVMYMLIMNTNEYLITVFHSNSSVVEYQMYYKLFSLGGTVFTLAMTPVWSAVTKAFAEHDTRWIDQLNSKLLKLSAVGTVLEFLLIPFLQLFLNVWLGENSIQVNYWYGIPFAILGSALIFNGALSSIANGIGELKTQMIFFGIGAAVKIPLAWLLVSVSGSWIGVVWANAAALIGYCFVQPVVLKKRIAMAYGQFK